jgi:protein subunit release factor B
MTPDPSAATGAGTHPPPYATDLATLEREAHMTFFRAGGPGGQHRNKVESAVRLFHPPSGVTVSATERRSQGQNRELAFERLAAKLQRLNHRPKKRVPTRPSKAAKRRRIESKKQRSEVKRGRRRADE